MDSAQQAGRATSTTTSQGSLKERHTIEIECSDQAVEELVPLLRELGVMGRQGSSRSIKIEDWDGKSSFGFDGDGNAKITTIKVDGEEIDEAKRRADKLLPSLREAEEKYAYTEFPAGFQYVPFNGTAEQLMEHVARFIAERLVDMGYADRDYSLQFTTQERHQAPGFSQEEALQLLESGENIRTSVVFEDGGKTGFCFMQRWDAMQTGMNKSQASLQGYLDKNEIRSKYEL